jgi:8-oxo-dGTP diphosphatase
VSKTIYVAGFMFEGDSVVLIKKNRPQWQAGLLNGIGGHVEVIYKTLSGDVYETPHEAMSREFMEETGYYTLPHDWKLFTTLSGVDYEVYFFVINGPVRELKTTTDEPIVVYKYDLITDEIAIPNLTWLLPLAKLALKGGSPNYVIQEQPKVIAPNLQALLMANV